MNYLIDKTTIVFKLCLLFMIVTLPFVYYIPIWIPFAMFAFFVLVIIGITTIATMYFILLSMFTMNLFQFIIAMIILPLAFIKFTDAAFSKIFLK